MARPRWIKRSNEPRINFVVSLILLLAEVVVSWAFSPIWGGLLVIVLAVAVAALLANRRQVPEWLLFAGLTMMLGLVGVFVIRSAQGQQSSQTITYQVSPPKPGAILSAGRDTPDVVPRVPHREPESRPTVAVADWSMSVFFLQRNRLLGVAYATEWESAYNMQIELGKSYHYPSFMSTALDSRMDLLLAWSHRFE